MSAKKSQKIWTCVAFSKLLLEGHELKMKTGTFFYVLFYLFFMTEE